MLPFAVCAPDTTALNDPDSATALTKLAWAANVLLKFISSDVTANAVCSPETTASN